MQAAGEDPGRDTDPVSRQRGELERRAWRLHRLARERPTGTYVLAGAVDELLRSADRYCAAVAQRALGGIAGDAVARHLGLSNAPARLEPRLTGRERASDAPGHESSVLDVTGVTGKRALGAQRTHQEVPRARAPYRNAVPLGVDEHGEATQTCTRCGAEKPLERFTRDAYRRSGRRSDCKDCEAVRRRERAAARAAAEAGEEWPGSDTPP